MQHRKDYQHGPHQNRGEPGISKWYAVPISYVTIVTHIVKSSESFVSDRGKNKIDVKHKSKLNTKYRRNSFKM